MKEPLVFLPDMMCDARLYWPQLMSFGRTRSVTIAPVGNASSMGAIAAAVMDGAPRRFALVGQGMGGMVAMEILRRAPERVTRISLIGTSPLPETPQMAAEREPRIIAAQTGKLAEAVKTELKLPSALAPGPGRMEVQSLVLDMADTLGPEAFISQSRALQRRPDQQKTMRTTKVPALVICGEHDTLFPVKRQEFMAELIPVARLEIVPDAGHFPTLEQPEVTTEILTDWLAAPMVLR
ncbi:alpha/beta fold hydrolase [Tropicimonas sediminicola]|uniref:Pimeloyl-ACP methyl ester carboxylesterase n=1 Tax=Tropicimonas sediminicola TaxID=1031541 RepID=A0A239KF85_9RHOB|nr:alpha/beta hydrolase [Tropicimonas sediminicola]SNT16725.1 Pimeloyl-ACP methyl ester carboxylesterase [Tropicimonas sediminicola]